MNCTEKNKHFSKLSKMIRHFVKLRFFFLKASLGKKEVNADLINSFESTKHRTICILINKILFKEKKIN